jgi:hypothetical protein
MDIALSSPFRVPVPLAPGESLLLVNASFWDARREEVRLQMEREDVQASIDLFKRQFLYPHIAQLTHAEVVRTRVRGLWVWEVGG